MAHTFPQLCLFLLRVYGFNPYKTGVFEFIRRLWTGFFFFLVVTFFLLELFLNFKGIKTLSRAIEIGPVLFLVRNSHTNLLPSNEQGQLTLDLYINSAIVNGGERFDILGASTLDRYLQCLYRFWHNTLTILKLIYLVRNPLKIKDMYERSKVSLQSLVDESTAEIGFKSQDFWKKCFEVFICLNLVVTTQVTIESLTQKKPFIMAYLENEKSEDTLYCGMIITINILFIFSTITTVLGYESSFVYFIAYCVAEMKMLKFAMEKCDLTTEEGRIEFNEILKHHVHILSFVDDISDSYSFILLCQYLTSLCAVCFALFLMTIDGMPPDLDHITRYGNLSFTYLLQLAILCVAGQFLIDECSNVGDIMFYKDWDEKLVRKNAVATVMMCHRTQKTVALSIGGFTFLNMESFGEVLKGCMSFLTFMQAVYEEKSGKMKD